MIIGQGSIEMVRQRKRKPTLYVVDDTKINFGFYLFLLLVTLVLKLKLTFIASFFFYVDRLSFSLIIY